MKQVKFSFMFGRHREWQRDYFKGTSLFYFILFIWLHWVLVVAWEIFS